MLAQYALIFHLLSPLFSKSQANRDTRVERFIKRACDGKIFRKTEQLPIFIIPEKEYEESIADWLLLRQPLVYCRNISCLISKQNIA